MQHRDKIILDKIIDEVNIATKMLSDIKQDDFVSDDILKRAAAMSVINIGELVKNLTFEFRNEYKNVPWKAISGFRDVAAHKYGTLDMNIVYNTVKIDIPMLKENIQQILKTADVKITELSALRREGACQRDGQPDLGERQARSCGG